MEHIISRRKHNILREKKLCLDENYFDIILMHSLPILLFYFMAGFLIFTLCVCQNFANYLSMCSWKFVIHITTGTFGGVDDMISKQIPITVIICHWYKIVGYAAWLIFYHLHKTVGKYKGYYHLSLSCATCLLFSRGNIC